MRMSKIVLASMVVVALAFPGCSPSSTATPTGCTSGYPDGGTVTGTGPPLVCDIAWSCNGDSQHYEIQCTRSNDNYDCSCISDTTTLAGNTFRVNPFVCDAQGSLPAATGGCGWM